MVILSGTNAATDHVGVESFYPRNVDALPLDVRKAVRVIVPPVAQPEGSVIPAAPDALAAQTPIEFSRQPVTSLARAWASHLSTVFESELDEWDEFVIRNPSEGEKVSRTARDVVRQIADALDSRALVSAPLHAHAVAREEGGVSLVFDNPLQGRRLLFEISGDDETAVYLKFVDQTHMSKHLLIDFPASMSGDFDWLKS